MGSSGPHYGDNKYIATLYPHTGNSNSNINNL